MYGGFKIDITDTYKYLGMWLDQRLTMEIAAKEIARSTSIAFGLIISNHYAAGGMDYKVFTKLFKFLVEPILKYGSVIWG